MIKTWTDGGLRLFEGFDRLAAWVPRSFRGISRWKIVRHADSPGWRVELPSGDLILWTTPLSESVGHRYEDDFSFDESEIP